MNAHYCDALFTPVRACLRHFKPRRIGLAGCVAGRISQPNLGTDADRTIAAYDPAAGTYDHKAEDMPSRFIASRLLLLLFTALIISFPSDSRSQPMSSLKEIRESGIVMQKWEKSCAAATIATVLTYGFHDPVSERYAAAKMLEKTDPKKVKLVGGFSLLDLKKFVVSRGYQATAYKGLSLEDLRLFKAPIVPINVYGYNHYVVFNGIKDNEVLLADPAFGHRTLSFKKFESIWLNKIAFVIEKKMEQQ